MKTVLLNHLRHSQPRQIGFLKRKTVTDYETSLGIVREISVEDRLPQYKLMSTKEPVKVEFY